MGFRTVPNVLTREQGSESWTYDLFSGIGYRTGNLSFTFFVGDT